MAALIDTSAVVAAVDRTDAAHARVVAALAAERTTILLPIVTLPEIAFLLGIRHGAAHAASAMGRMARRPRVDFRPLSGSQANVLANKTEVARLVPQPGWIARSYSPALRRCIASSAAARNCSVVTSPRMKYPVGLE
jgi:hypothetical protein